jgi:hypothetical protein
VTLIVDILDQIVDTLETAFATVDDIDVQVWPRRVLDPTSPCVDMYPGDPTRTAEGAGMGDVAGALVLTLRARVNTADQDHGQELLLAMMDEEDPLSVANALHADQTLNGTVSSLRVEGPFGHVLYEDPGRNGALLGIDWRVTILRSRSLS